MMDKPVEITVALEAARDADVRGDRPGAWDATAKRAADLRDLARLEPERMIV